MNTNVIKRNFRRILRHKETEGNIMGKSYLKFKKNNNFLTQKGYIKNY